MRIDYCRECNKYGKVVGQGLCKTCYGRNYQRKRAEEVKERKAQMALQEKKQEPNMNLTYQEANKQQSYMDTIKERFSAGTSEAPIETNQEYKTSYSGRTKKRRSKQRILKDDLKVLGAMCRLEKPTVKNIEAMIKPEPRIVERALRTLRAKKIVEPTGEIVVYGNYVYGFNLVGIERKLENYFKKLISNKDRMHLQQVLDHLSKINTVNKGSEPELKKTSKIQKFRDNEQIEEAITILKLVSGNEKLLQKQMWDLKTENAELKKENVELRKWKENLRSALDR